MTFGIQFRTEKQTEWEERMEEIILLSVIVNEMSVTC